MSSYEEYLQEKRGKVREPGSVLDEHLNEFFRRTARARAIAILRDNLITTPQDWRECRAAGLVPIGGRDAFSGQAGAFLWTPFVPGSKEARRVALARLLLIS